MECPRSSPSISLVPALQDNHRRFILGPSLRNGINIPQPSSKDQFSNICDEAANWRICCDGRYLFQKNTFHRLTPFVNLYHIWYKLINLYCIWYKLTLHPPISTQTWFSPTSKYIDEIYALFCIDKYMASSTTEWDLVVKMAIIGGMFFWQNHSSSDHCQSWQ